MQNSVMMPSQPQLGTPVPGTTGGLPALSGLSVTQNPAAQQLQSMGRGDDTMLVHMTPNEVNSLQGLAMSAGGSLTINPHTGLPEAGFLGKILPTLLGLGLSFIPGVGPLMAAGIVGAGTTALTGDLSKGLMAGLGAFGGASLAGAAGLGAAGGAAKAGAGAAGGTGAGATTGAATGATATIPGAVPGMVGTQVPASMLTDIGGQAINLTPSAAKTLATTAAKAPGTGFLSKFSSAAQQGLPSGILQKAAPYAAGAGLLNTISEATAPQMPKYNSEEDDFEYVPMRPGVREVRFQSPEEMRRTGGAEFQYFTPSNPEPIPLYGQPRGFAEGGLAAVPTQGFEDLVSFFNATNPGAITASMYPTSPAATPGTATPTPTSAPAGGGETVYDFRRPTGGNLGSTGTSDPYGILPGLSGLGGFNFGTADYDAIINRLRDDIGFGSVVPPAPAPAPTPSVPAPTPSVPAPTVPYIPTVIQRPGDIDTSYPRPEFEDIYTPPTYTPAPAPAPAPTPLAPSAPPTMLPQPENYPLPEVFNFEDIYTPPAPTTPAPTTPAPTMPAPTKPAPNLPVPVMPTLAKPAPTVAPAPSVPAPSAPPTMLPQPENYPLPEVLNFEDIMATYTPPPVQFYGGGGGGGYFDTSMPFMEAYASGGAVNMRDGSFVVDARTVSELGNGSSNAGIEMLSRMGGRPVRGPGDGVSDSVRASIGGKQEARVARDEVIFSPEAVRRLGGGSDAKGTKKLYALMDKAHKARKKAKRGQDTRVRKGLA